MYRENIDKQIASAMKSGDNVRLSVWRSIKTEFVKFQTSGSNIELTDDKELQIIQKMAQQRLESKEQYTKAGRTDLANAEDAEYTILNSLLPQEPTEEDIHAVIKNLGRDSFTMKDMRDVMSAVRAKYPTVNGGLVSKIFKENYIQ